MYRVEMFEIPNGITEGLEEKLKAMAKDQGWGASHIKMILRKAKQNGERVERERLRAERAKEAFYLPDLNADELQESALLATDHVAGTLKVAQLLEKTIDAHTKLPAFGAPAHRVGKINTMLDYIVAHIFLRSGVKMSKKPLQDLRAVNTREDADACGISYKNLTLVWSCLLYIQRSKEALPFGDEKAMAAMAHNMDSDAKTMWAEEKTTKRRKGQKLANTRNARATFFPTLKVCDKGESVAQRLRRVEENKLLSVAESGEDVSRTADHGGFAPEDDGEETDLGKENRRLIEMLMKR
jgi:hypothetical protein